MSCCNCIVWSMINLTSLSLCNEIWLRQNDFELSFCLCRHTSSQTTSHSHKHTLSLIISFVLVWGLIALNRLILNRAVNACLELTTCLVMAFCWLLPLVLHYNWLRDGRLWRYLLHSMAICSAGVKWGVLRFDVNRMFSHTDVLLCLRSFSKELWACSLVTQPCSSTGCI